MSDDVKSRIQEDLKKARKAREKLRTVVLTTLLSDIRNAEIAAGGQLSADAVIGVLSRALKQRREAAEQMADAGRGELAEKEEREAEMVSAYLPEPLSEAAVREMVREAIAEGVDAMGPLMGRIMPRLKGRFDGREAQRIVREELDQG